MNKSPAQRLERMNEEYRAKVARNMDGEYQKTLTRGDRISDKVASFGGSWKFIIIFGSILVAWILLNSLPGLKHFDPSPFILLNLALSFLAGFQAPFIMMAQNRHAQRDKVASDVDYAINFHAEKEIDILQQGAREILNELQALRQEVAALKSTLPDGILPPGSPG